MQIWVVSFITIRLIIQRVGGEVGRYGRGGKRSPFVVSRLLRLLSLSLLGSVVSVVLRSNSKETVHQEIGSDEESEQEKLVVVGRGL